MQKTSTRLALLAAAAVACAIIAATIAFNYFIGWKIETDATEAIEYALELGEGDDGMGRTPNFIILDKSYAISPAERRWSTANETKLAAWFSEHPSEGIVQRITIDGWTCYAAIVPYIDYEQGYGTGAVNLSSDGYCIGYIDIASEQSLVFSINVAFAIISAIGMAIAAFAGATAGKRIDLAQDAQKRFYENMSHELKTPLAAIRGFAEGSGSGVIDAAKASRAIERETVRATEMIEEILSLSKLEAGTVEPHKETVVVSDFVQDCLMPFEGTAKSKGLAVELELSGEPAEVEADLDLFEHAFTNVLTNAMRHAATTIRIVYADARLSVWNDGSIPNEDQLKHLFDRFYTGDNGSSGIGLAIAKEAAELHGWSIAAKVYDSGVEITFGF